MSNAQTFAPRFALTPDGDVVFIDDGGKKISPPEKEKEDFLKDVNANELINCETVSVYTVRGSCRLWVCIGGRWYCVKYNCATGKFEGFC